MKGKMVGICICMLLITTAISSAGSLKQSSITPNDPEFNKQWALENTGQTGGTSDADVDAPEAWEIEVGDPDIVIAIIDSGIDYSHPDLVDNIWINDDEIPDNSIDDDENGYIDDFQGYNFYDYNNDIKDNHGHGTLVAGIAGAVTNNNVGVAGMAWNCKLMIVKVWDQNFITTVDQILEGIYYAVDNGAKVISLSIGAYEEQLTPEELQDINDTADYAYANGCISVAGAGNDNTDNPLYPAACRYVIAVAGTDHNDERMKSSSSFASNYGEWVDVAAPGKLIYTTAPTYPHTYGELNYTQRIGTSFACPIVSRLAALILSKNPLLTPDEVKSIICINVDPYDSSYYLGSGRINAFKALSAPYSPTINGPAKGKKGESLSYTFNVVDPEGDNVRFIINWGDGESNTTDFVASGTDKTVSHIWSKTGNYIFNASAEDTFGNIGPTTTFTVVIPRNKAINKPLQNFLQSHPILFPLLQKLIRVLGL